MIEPLTRNQAIRAARTFFHERRLLEVRTAKCVSAGAMEPYIDTFALQSSLTGHAGYLASSPEFAMKKIIAAELRQNPAAVGIYEIAPVFRDDRAGSLHLPEFTMIEWYAQNTGRHEILTMAVELISYVAAAVGKAITPPQLTTVDLREILAERGFSPAFDQPQPYTQSYATHFGRVPQHYNQLDGEIACFNLLFDEVVQPVIRDMPGIVAVEGFPDCLAALARSDGQTAARTELFVSGVELANAYSEEYEAALIRQRWQAYNEIRRLRGVAEHPIDEQLLGLANTLQGVCGIAVGLERLLLMLPDLAT
ncbi:MAG: amino acid--tRNA ligase-related protein [Spirochaetota bacterium]